MLFVSKLGSEIRWAVVKTTELHHPKHWLRSSSIAKPVKGRGGKSRVSSDEDDERRNFSRNAGPHFKVKKYIQVVFSTTALCYQEQPFNPSANNYNHRANFADQETGFEVWTAGRRWKSGLRTVTTNARIVFGRLWWPTILSVL